MMSSNGGGGGGGGGQSSGPCGACKFLRRKCVRGCVFAPYFDSEHGAAHFAAVHRVFGASNASKLLLRIPAHRRLDAVITLCYEALARVRDPVYGCVAHVFSLQQRVVNLQAELACVQARISTLQRSPTFPSSQPPPPAMSPPDNFRPNSSDHHQFGAVRGAAIFDRAALAPSEETSPEMASFCNSADQDLDDAAATDLQAQLARDYVSRYFPGVRFRPSTP
ncbi:LOB domain-containing protein 19 [Andrographis paniculata]|uniref:LOB domain-containing protein 19 n=1 Tax=Andrographis paniculata TaxID=175694 RepID=UPI0021E97066|nr:LOB domain-containing protein 19 [Andrographis paniculata]